MLKTNNSPVPRVVKEKACMLRANLAYTPGDIGRGSISAF